MLFRAQYPLSLVKNTHSTYLSLPSIRPTESIGKGKSLPKANLAPDNVWYMHLLGKGISRSPSERYWSQDKQVG